MDLKRVLVFMRVVELGGFTRAARALGLPTSSVSRSITQLEDDLGVRLLERSTRTLRLTEAGEAYAARAAEGLRVLSEAETEVRRFGTELVGRVRITAPPDFGGFLAEFCLEMQQKLPHITLEFMLTPRKLDLLSDGFDLGLRAASQPDEQLIARRAGVLRLGLYCAANQKAPSNLEQLLAQEHVMLRGRGNVLRLTDGSQERVLEVRSRYSTNDMAMLWHLVARGVGVGLLPVFFGDQGMREGLMQRVLPKLSQEGTPVHVVMLGGRHHSPTVLAVRNALLESLRARPWWSEPGHPPAPAGDKRLLTGPTTL